MKDFWLRRNLYGINRALVYSILLLGNFVGLTLCLVGLIRGPFFLYLISMPIMLIFGLLLWTVLFNEAKR